MLIPIEISARHIHLCQTDLEALFGVGYMLQKKTELSQVGEFAAEETLLLITNKGELNVRIIGPIREKTQVEISYSDARVLGILVPLRISGDLAGSASIKLLGPKDEVELTEGVIIAKRHLHISSAQAQEFGLKNNQNIRIRIPGERGGILNNVIVRSGENFHLSLHLDTDEANALGISKENSFGELLID